ncbi:ABC transporter substrate-binding protein [Alteromonas alba]|jgi:NitT/TauT family transport system substrate-binding protein|uniref:ABC transporter substrate-binding protein n=1 Tax=Alteromonas alba TaxID=2079529 RepID=A0A2S9V3E3_9ALTE|nr:transporter substrate-binding domain-containing protein [Alteromonas alba]PRO70976.1 ABC transporter substrate-binding protein [Alteromonas alba]
MMIRVVLCSVILWCSALTSGARAADLPEIRVGVLKYGTLNWELDLAEAKQLPEQYGFKLTRVALGSPQALSVALQGGAVDMIVGDWLWAARQFDEGRLYHFYPYSTAAGELVVDAKANASDMGDLQGKTIGFAGGKGNKNWLLYSAYAKQHFNFDLDQQATIKFAAPPMLNQLMLRDQLDAVVNFWHYAAELKTHNKRSLLTMDEVLASWQIGAEVPVIGWLFKQDWASRNKALIDQFFAMSFDTRALMDTDDNVWQLIPSFTNKYSEGARPVLIEHYRRGIPTRFDENITTDLQKLFRVLKQNEGTTRVTGSLESLPQSLFWQSPALGEH